MVLNILPRIKCLLLSMLLLCTALAPMNTKIAGAAWFLVVLLGLFSAFQKNNNSDSQKTKAAYGWFIATSASLLIFMAMTAYWQDSWGALHVQLRVFLAAAACLAFVRCYASSPKLTRWIAHAITVSCAVAFFVTWKYGRETPSNPIPWAVGISFLPCLLLPNTLNQQEKLIHRGFWSVGVLLGIAAVLLSLTRGAYGILLWALFFYGLVFFHKMKLSKKQLVVGGATLLLVSAAVFYSPRLWQEPLQDVQQGWHEAKDFVYAGDPTQAMNTSVGVRLYFWPLAFSAIQQSPWLGMGRAHRKIFIHQQGLAMHSPVLAQLDHFHNDYLTFLVDYGVIGLFGFMALIGGLALLIWQFAQWDSIAAWQLSGILFMSSTGSLTNANFSHNFYGVMLALSISLVLLTARDSIDEKEI